MDGTRGGDVIRRALCVVALVLIGVACSSDDEATTTTAAAGDGASPEAAVSIADFAYSPNPITVAVGGTVTWTNTDTGLPHTSTSSDGLWNSETLQPGDSFSFTFEEAGTFEYVCNIHSSMSGTVTVEG
jgi:plastocyanin